MGARSFMQEAAKIVRLSRKPDQSEIWLSVKIVFLGVGILGAYGYIIMLIANLLSHQGG
jgi:protein translocase SEC61 complex gamma subunit